MPARTIETDLPALALIRDVAPESYDRIRAADVAAADAADPELVELARVRIAGTLRGSQPETLIPALAEKLRALDDWPKSPLFTERERACLALTDQFVFSVADVDQALIDDVLAHMEPAELYGFMNALYVLDATERLNISLTRIFDGDEEQR